MKARALAAAGAAQVVETRTSKYELPTSADVTLYDSKQSLPHCIIFEAQ